MTTKENVFKIETIPTESNHEPKLNKVNEMLSLIYFQNNPEEIEKKLRKRFKYEDLIWLKFSELININIDIDNNSIKITLKDNLILPLKQDKYEQCLILVKKKKNSLKSIKNISLH